MKSCRFIGSFGQQIISAMAKKKVKKKNLVKSVSAYNTFWYILLKPGHCNKKVFSSTHGHNFFLYYINLVTVFRIQIQENLPKFKNSVSWNNYNNKFFLRYERRQTYINFDVFGTVAIA